MLAPIFGRDFRKIFPLEEGQRGENGCKIMVDILSESLMTNGVPAVTGGQVFSRISDCRLKKHLAKHPLRSFKILWC